MHFIDLFIPECFYILPTQKIDLNPDIELLSALPARQYVHPPDSNTFGGTTETVMRIFPPGGAIHHQLLCV